MLSCVQKPHDLSALLFHNSPLPYLVLHTATLQVTDANTAAAVFFDCSPAQLLSACFTDFLASEEERRYGLLKKFSTTAQPFFLCFRTGTGTTTAQVFTSTLAAEEPLLGVMLVRSIPPAPATDKEALMAGMVEESNDVLTAADLEFKPITWSKAAERLYGLSRDQAVGQNVRDFITDICYHNSSAAEVRNAARTSGNWRGEMTYTRPADGKKITLLITFKLITNKQNEPLHYVISGTDITDRKETEARLQESENRFREVADSAPVGIWMSEVTNKVVYINKPLADYTGVNAAAFTNALWVSLIHPDDVDGILKKFSAHVQQRQPVTMIYRLKHNSGAYHWVQDSGTPRVLTDGTFMGYIGSIVDINDTKQREAQLQYQAALLNHVLDSIITTDLNFVVQSCNSVAAEVYGLPEVQIQGRCMADLAQFKYIGTTKEAALMALRQDGVWKGEVDVTVNGTERNFLFTVTYITDGEGHRTGVMMVGREITDRKRAEKTVQESESFYRNLITNALDCMLLTNAAGFINFASSSIKTILGYDVSEAFGRNAFEFVHPDDHIHAWTAFQREVSENPEVKFIQIRILKKDGTWIWCMVRGHNLLDNPHIGCIAIYLHDDSHRKRANDALKESEQRFRALIKDLKLGVTLENAEGTILMYNKATADLFCVAEPSLEGATVYGLLKKLVHEDETPLAPQDWPMRRAAQTKKPVQDVVIGIGPATSRTWLLVNSNPVLDESGTVRHIISSFTDVTEHKKLAQRLLDQRINQQRLLTQATIDGQERERKEIGKELHDNIGQQLATTKLYLDLVKNATVADAAAILTRAAKSISEVINEVRTISHSLVPPTLGDLGLVESVHELCNSISLVQHLQIDFKHCGFSEAGLPENAKLMLYRIIQEALNNIIKHAGATAVQIQLTRNAQAILLQVQDNGQGFAPDNVRNGLGLNNIRNRAELFGGSVAINTAPGAGCTVQVTIPDIERAKYRETQNSKGKK